MSRLDEYLNTVRHCQSMRMEPQSDHFYHFRITAEILCELLMDDGFKENATRLDQLTYIYCGMKFLVRERI